uniref:Uncharacterized protein n=1 Tax=Rhizophora mucronata TaxID=61149 RepID=A0A2P2QTS9_RHIMU
MGINTMRKLTVWATEKQVRPPESGKQLLKMQLKSLQTMTGLTLLMVES